MNESMNDVEKRVEEVRKIFFLTDSNEYEGVPFREVHKKLEELMGRPVWTHEFAFPTMLIEELEHGRPMEAFEKSVEAIAREKPVIMVVKE